MSDSLNQNFHNAADFGIPTAVKKTFTFVAAGASDDDKIATITYLGPADGYGNRVTLGVLTLAYVGSTNNIASITRTT